MGSDCSDAGGRWLTKRGIKKLIECSLKRNDQLNVNDAGEYWVSNSCYLRYTKDSNISTSSQSKEFERELKRTRLENESPYGYKTHCLVCENVLDFEAAQVSQ